MRHFVMILFLLVALSLSMTSCRKKAATESSDSGLQPTGSLSADKDTVELRILQWGENTVLKEPFEKYAMSHGVKLKAVMVEPFIEEHNDVFDGIRAEKCDLAMSPAEIIKTDNAKLAKVLLPIDVGRIRNYDAIAKSIRTSHLIQDTNTVDGLLYGVPFDSDVQTLLYNTQRLSTPPDSYAELWDDAHKNRIATMGWLGGYNVAITLLAMGYNPDIYYNMDADKIDDWDMVKSKVDGLVANSRIIYGNMFLTPPWKFDAMELSQCDILFGWGSIQRLLSETAGNWKIALPKEGSEFWVDDVFLASHLKNQPEKLAAAYLWIDFLLESQTQIERYKGDPPINAPINAQAMKTLREQGYDDPRLDEDFYASPRLFLSRQTDKRTRNYYRIVWADALKKAGKIKERGYLEEESPTATAPAK